MDIKHYPPHNGGGFTADEVRKNVPTVFTDVTCPWCGKLQPEAATQYLGGPCVRCGGLTSGAQG